jgi:hypothetical protein
LEGGHVECSRLDTVSVNLEVAIIWLKTWCWRIWGAETVIGLMEEWMLISKK